jgi:hypothetical protein
MTQMAASVSLCEPARCQELCATPYLNPQRFLREVSGAHVFHECAFSFQASGKKWAYELAGRYRSHGRHTSTVFSRGRRIPHERIRRRRGRAKVRLQSVSGDGASHESEYNFHGCEKARGSIITGLENDTVGRSERVFNAPFAIH